MGIQFRSAVLFVKDMAVSRRFYEDLLGQQVEMDFGPNVGYVGGFALWEVGHAFSVVYRREPEAGPALGRDNLEIYFEAAELESIQQRLSEAGVKEVHAIYEQPWGQRTLRVYDPDGHIVEIGEPMDVTVKRMAAQGMEKEAISAQTGMPLAIVEYMLAGVSAG